MSNTQTPSPRPHRGFTLIELLTVVVILGIATAVVLPQIGPHEDLKVASGARELTADLLYAQSQAIATGKTHYVVFSPDHASYALMDAVNPPSVIPHPTMPSKFEVGFEHGPLDGIALERISFDGETTLAFDAMGAPYSCTSSGKLSALNAGTLVLESGEHKLTLIIAPGTGAITVK